MKTLKYLAMLCFLVGFTACSSDDDKNDNSNSLNHFTYQGTTYELKAGVIERGDTEWSDDGSTEYYIVLTTSGITEDPDGEPIPTESIISMIDFVLYSKNNTKPKIGTYTFDSNNYIDFTFDESEILVNVGWDSDSFDYDAYLSVKSGTLEMHKTGDTYKMDFELTTTTNEIIKGHYEGELYFYEYDGYYRPSQNNILKARGN